MTGTTYADHFYIKSDSDQFISQLLLTLTTCSSYLLDTQSLCLMWLELQDRTHQLACFDHCATWLLIEKKNASANMTKKMETLCKEVFLFFDISDSLILTEDFICCPDTVRFCVHEQSALVVRFYLQQWAGFWKVTVPVFSLAPRLLHLLSRCPIMKLQVRQHPSHYSLH